MIAAALVPKDPRYAEQLVRRAVGAGPCTFTTSRLGVLATDAGAPFDASVVLSDDALTAHRGPTASALFVATRGDTVLLSDRILSLRTMMDAAGISTELDPEALSALVGYGMMLPEDTPYMQIRRVPPRTRLRFTADGSRLLERVALPELDDVRGDVDDLAKDLYERLRQAVASAMNGHSLVAVLASGGVDSSGVLAAAVAEGRDRVVAVVLETSPESTDATHFRALERMVRGQVVRLGVNDVDEAFAQSFTFDGVPYASSTLPHDLAFARCVRGLGVKLVLTGVGGDELLGGIPDSLAEEVLSAPLSALRGIQQQSGLGSKAARVASIAKPLLRRVVPASVRRRRIDASLEPHWLLPPVQRTRRVLAARNFANALRPTTASQRYQRMADAEGWRWISDVRGHWESVAQVRRFDTFMAPSLMAHVTRLSPSLLWAGQQHRGLYRLALAGHVPDGLRARTDKGGFDDLALTMLRRHASRLRPLCVLEGLRSRGVVEPSDGFRAFFEMVLARGGNVRELDTVFMMLACEAFALGEA